MEKDEYDGIEVKADDVIYIVYYPDNRHKPFLGKAPIESLTFNDFTQEQKDEVKSWIQDVATEVSEAARTAQQASDNAREYAAQAKSYLDQLTESQTTVNG